MYPVRLLFGLLGGLFLYLAVRWRRDAGAWTGARRLRARVTAVRYGEVWEDGTTVDDARSTARVTAAFTWEGREYLEERTYQGIREAPAVGDVLPILLDPETGAWAPRTEVRHHWLLMGALAAVCLATALVFTLGGERAAAELTAFRVGAPSLTGCVFLAALGALCGLGAWVCVRFLMPMGLRPVVYPLAWGLARALGRGEPVEARCLGVVCQRDSDGAPSYFPYFAWKGPAGEVRWCAPDAMGRLRYRAGTTYRLYRDGRTGRLLRPPTGREIAAVPLALLPLLFFGMMTLSMLLSAAGLLLCAALSAPLP